jgi:serine/threonine protein kinase
VLMADVEIKVDEIPVPSCNVKKLSGAPQFGNRFSKMVRIGRGTFGEVWKGYDSVHQCWVAVKKFNEVNSDHLGVNMMVIREISLLRKLNHPNITKTLDVLIGKDINCESLLLVMVRD